MRTQNSRKDLGVTQSHISRLMVWRPRLAQGGDPTQGGEGNSGRGTLTCFSLVDYKLSIGQRHKHLVIQIPRKGKGVMRGFRKPKEVT